ncbi:carbohydrate sulfotransferase 14-like [Amphiura filiformis]|uniref:carbohydrate sulfotransferase 14-like n=1 Tax=Amphiura filiformis TaxID=82378 RepID=UPI003B213CB8
MSISMSAVDGFHVVSLFFQSPQSLDVHMAEEQQRRRQRITAACNKYNISSDWVPEKINDYSQRALVNDKYKILLHYIPKVSCSTWKDIFKDLFIKTRDNETEKLFHGGIRVALRFTPISGKEKIRKLKTYKKVLFVREPFHRALSAFLSKFHPLNSSHVQGLWETAYGNQIASMYRPGHKPRMIPEVDPSDPENGTVYNFLDIKFSEFLQYLTDIDEQNGGETPINLTNDHWLQMNRISNACVMKYDFIGYYENLAIEGPYVLRWLGVDHLVQFPDVHVSRAHQSLLNEYRKIPLELLQRLWKFYQVDYEMFGYSINDTLGTLMRGLFQR